MNKLFKLSIIPLFVLSLTSCGLLEGLFEGDQEGQYSKEYNEITGKYYLYDHADKRFTYHDTYFDIDGGKGSFSLKYYENGELKKEGKIQKIVTKEDYIGKWANVLHINVKCGDIYEHISTYTESLSPINQFRIIEEYNNKIDKYYLSELPFVLGTYVREGEEYKEETPVKDQKIQYIPATFDHFTSELDGFFKFDEQTYFYFVCPRAWITPDGSFINSYFQYYSPSLSKPIEGFASGYSFEYNSTERRQTLNLKTLRDSVDWGEGTEGRISFGYYTFDEEDHMINHDGTVDFSNGTLNSFTFEHLSRQWTDNEWNRFIKSDDPLPDAILYEYIGGTYTKAQYEDPEFSVRIGDCLDYHDELDIGNNLNLSSTYTLSLKRNNKEYYPNFSDISFIYDKEYIEIIDCISSRQSQNNSEYYHYQFVWYLKPLRETESISIKVLYRDKESVSINVSISDLSVESMTCAEVEKTLDSVAEDFPNEITTFKDYQSWKDFNNIHQYFGYIKNEPNSSSFVNYEYAFIRTRRDSFGNNPTLNSVFIQNETLYYDFISEKDYFEERPDSTMTTEQRYYLCLFRYPSNLNYKNNQIWYSTIYKAS